MKISLAPATLLLCIALAPLPAAAGQQEDQAACMPPKNPFACLTDQKHIWEPHPSSFPLLQNPPKNPLSAPFPYARNPHP